MELLQFVGPRVIWGNCKREIWGNCKRESAREFQTNQGAIVSVSHAHNCLKYL
jgi:hypothetical protein